MLKLKKTIISFLNHEGGRIYIGIQDNNNKVQGIHLKLSDKDKFTRYLDDMLWDIKPTLVAGQIRVHYIPVKNSEGWVPGKFVVKVVIKR